MQTRLQRTILTLSAAVSLACSEDSIFEGGQEFDDTGLTTPNIDLPDDEGETPALLPPGECTQDPSDGWTGVWHQCMGRLQFEFSATYQGEEFTGGDTIFFGPGRENPSYWTQADRYELPLVAACCGPFDYEDPSTSDKIPYVTNCLFDAVQQICVGVPFMLRRQAEVSPLGTKIALEWLATQIDANQGECLWGLWHQGPPGPEGQAVNELWGTSWSIPNVNADLRVAELTVNDWTEAGEVEEMLPCSGVFDNDAAIVPTAPFDPPDSAPGEVLPLALPSSALGTSPWSNSEAFELEAGASTLALAHDPSAATLIAGLTLVAALDDADPVDYAQLVLAQPLTAEALAGEYVVPTGEASFVAALSSGGQSRVVTMINAEPLVYRARGEGWEFDPVELVYDEAEVGVWRLHLDGLDFEAL